MKIIITKCNYNSEYLNTEKYNTFAMFVEFPESSNELKTVYSPIDKAVKPYHVSAAFMEGYLDGYRNSYGDDTDITVETMEI